MIHVAPQGTEQATHPDVQRFIDEADKAKADLIRIACEIITLRLTANPHLISQEMQWAVTSGRTDVARRILDLLDQYENSKASACMTEQRLVESAYVAIMRRPLQAEDEDLPAYLRDEDFSSP